MLRSFAPRTRFAVALGTLAALPLATAPASAALCDRKLELKSPRMFGDDIEDAQKLLRQRGENVPNTDGVYGTGTVAAVKSFQKKWDLKVDGKVGPLTCKKLKG